MHFTALLFTAQSKTLIQTLRFSHCALDIERSHVLPVLLQKGDQEIDGKIDICHKFILAHFNMANGHSKTENLKFNNESTSLLYQISWPSQMVAAAFCQPAYWVFFHKCTQEGRKQNQKFVQDEVRTTCT